MQPKAQEHPGLGSLKPARALCNRAEFSESAQLSMSVYYPSSSSIQCYNTYLESSGRITYRTYCLHELL